MQQVSKRWRLCGLRGEGHCSNEHGEGMTQHEVIAVGILLIIAGLVALWLIAPPMPLAM